MVDPLWFKARAFGWGWTPITWQGWLVLGIFVGLTFAGIAVYIHEVKAGAQLRAAQLLFTGWLGLLVGGLILVCWLTGERPRWRWGG